MSLIGIVKYSPEGVFCQTRPQLVTLMKHLKLGIILWLFASLSLGIENIKLFPINNYPQKLDYYLVPNSHSYFKPLMSKAKQHYHYYNFYQRYYSSSPQGLSPWSMNYISLKTIQSAIKSIENLTQKYEAQVKQQKLFAANYKPYSLNWIQSIKKNMRLEQINNFNYTPQNRAIVIDNLALRSLPTNAPLYYSYKIAGEGYPFDQLQQTSLYIGMPLYIIATTQDQVWSLVISTDAIGWVETNKIAKISSLLIKQWQKTAQNGIIALTQNSPILDRNGNFQTLAYLTTTLPLVKSNSNYFTVLIPKRNSAATTYFKKVILNTIVAVKMPMELTPANLNKIVEPELGKTYGWGGYLFNYDCSSLLKAIFTPFGIYLPRNSQDQWRAASKIIYLDQLSPIAREQYLIKYAHPMVTLVQIPGHILLYLGAYTQNNKTTALSLQDIWGLRPATNNFRAIIGSAVILPLLQSYPEDTSLLSFYAKQRYKFRLIYLD